jgi:hypothetical protein
MEHRDGALERRLHLRIAARRERHLAEVPDVGMAFVGVRRHMQGERHEQRKRTQQAHHETSFGRR